MLTPAEKDKLLDVRHPAPIDIAGVEKTIDDIISDIRYFFRKESFRGGSELEVKCENFLDRILVDLEGVHEKLDDVDELIIAHERAHVELRDLAWDHAPHPLQSLPDDTQVVAHRL